MAGSPAQVAEKMAASTASEDALDVLLANLMLGTPQDHNRGRIISASDDDGDGDGDDGVKPRRKSNVARASGNVDSDEHDPWKALSDQMNEEISRQIYAELDKQLDEQMMAELDKCQAEQTRQMDEELDRQLEEQLDAMLNASIDREAPRDGTYEYYSDEYGYSSGEEENELENLPWSEGGEGGIGSLGLRQVPIEHGVSTNSNTIPGSILGTPKYTQEELQRMVDNLYGDGTNEKVAGPGAWGKAKWRPGGKDKKGRK